MDDSHSPLVLGVDPGLNTTGYSLVRLCQGRPQVVEAGVVRSRRSQSLETRLAEIHRGIVEVLASFHPAVMAIEELYSHYERPQTAILMGHARGVICLAAAAAGVPIAHYAATQVKKTLTGSGRAPKAQIQGAICREFGLAAVPEPPDVADALALAVCHLHFSRHAAPSQQGIPA